MNSEEPRRTLTIILVVAVAIGLIIGILYLIFGLTLAVQSISFGITFTLLVIIIIILAIISLYLWIKSLWQGRDLRKCQKENTSLKKELDKYKSQQEHKNETKPTESKISQIKDIFKK